MKRIEDNIKIKDGDEKDGFTCKIEKDFRKKIQPLMSFKYICKYTVSKIIFRPKNEKRH